MGTGAKVGIGAVGALVLIGGGAFAFSQTVGKTPVAASSPPVVSASASPRVSASASAAPSSLRPSVTASSARPTSASPKASSTASKRPDAATLGADGTITGPGFTTKMPSGWKISDDNGTKSRAMEIIDKDNNLISVFDSDRGEAPAVCQSWADDFKASSDKVEKLADTTWGGLPATNLRLKTFNSDAGEDEIFVFTCAKKGTTVYVLASVTWTDNEATVKAAADSVKASWVWK